MCEVKPHYTVTQVGRKQNHCMQEASVCLMSKNQSPKLRNDSQREGGRSRRRQGIGFGVSVKGVTGKMCTKPIGHVMATLTSASDIYRIRVTLTRFIRIQIRPHMIRIYNNFKR